MDTSNVNKRPFRVKLYYVNVAVVIFRSNSARSECICYPNEKGCFCCLHVNIYSVHVILVVENLPDCACPPNFNAMYFRLAGS